MTEIYLHGVKIVVNEELPEKTAFMRQESLDRLLDSWRRQARLIEAAEALLAYMLRKKDLDRAVEAYVRLENVVKQAKGGNGTQNTK